MGSRDITISAFVGEGSVLIMLGNECLSLMNLVWSSEMMKDKMGLKQHAKHLVSIFMLTDCWGDIMYNSMDLGLFYG